MNKDNSFFELPNYFENKKPPETASGFCDKVYGGYLAGIYGNVKIAMFFD